MHNFRVTLAYCSGAIGLGFHDFTTTSLIYDFIFRALSYHMLESYHRSIDLFMLGLIDSDSYLGPAAKSYDFIFRALTFSLSSRLALGHRPYGLSLDSIIHASGLYTFKT